MLNKIHLVYNWIEVKLEQKKITKSLILLFKIIKKLVALSFLSLVILKFFFKKKKAIEFGNNNIVISLTSFPKRISSIWLTLDSIDNQTIMPSKICLYLSTQEFPDGFLSLPSKIKRYAKRGVDIIFVEENLRSHLKYFYAFQSFKNSCIVTIDDDLYYPKDTIESLLELNKKFPNSICANMANRVKFGNGIFSSYLLWERGISNSSNKFNLALGVGGVLYPPCTIYTELFDKNKIRELAFYADDLWLKAIQLVKGIEVAVGEHFPHPIVIPFTQKISLKKINSQGQVLNDSQWQALSKYFSLMDYLK